MLSDLDVHCIDAAIRVVPGGLGDCRWGCLEVSSSLPPPQRPMPNRSGRCHQLAAATTLHAHPDIAVPLVVPPTRIWGNKHRLNQSLRSQVFQLTQIIDSHNVIYQRLSKPKRTIQQTGRVINIFPTSMATVPVHIKHKNAQKQCWCQIKVIVPTVIKKGV